MTVDGIRLDLNAYRILPGLINSHDHLEFALFPRLGRGTYANATEWARDIYLPDQPPVAQHLRVPKRVRLFWGGLRNLVAGVTTVCHHNPYDAAFISGFPVRVVRRFGWAHSFAFDPDALQRYNETPATWPFIMHVAEGTDQQSAHEIFRLRQLGMLRDRTVLVHGVGLDGDGWQMVQQCGASVIWCPRSNIFTLGRSLSRALFDQNLPITFGTDSALTAEGDLLDEIRYVRSEYGLGEAAILKMITGTAASVLRLAPQTDDWIAVREFGEPPDLVVIGGRIQLISRELANGAGVDMPAPMHRLRIEGRPDVLVRYNVRALLDETRAALQKEEVHLAGRLVLQ